MKLNNGLPWLLAGLAAVVAGYAALGAGDITAAPILLVLGYCILVPVALLKGFRSEKGE
jgi:hypothetical protein